MFDGERHFRGLRPWHLGVVTLAAGALLMVDRGAVTPSPESDILAVTHASVIPMDRERVLPDHTVLIRDGRVAALGPSSEIDSPAASEVVDAGGRYLLPGLVDVHVHLRARSELAIYLRYGVTTVVNMRGSPDHVRLRRQIEQGDVVSPRLYTTGPLLDGDPPIRPGDGTRVVATPEAAAEVVQEHVVQGYDLVKVYNHLRPDVLKSVVKEAHTGELGVVGHLPRRPERRQGLEAALEAGLDMIAHAEEVFFTHFGGAPDSVLTAGTYVRPTEAELREAARLIADAGIWVTPNLSFVAMTDSMLEDVDAVFDHPEFQRLSPDVREMWRTQNPTRRDDPGLFARRIEALYDFGQRFIPVLSGEEVPLLAGTDATGPGLFPGLSLHVELRELARAGLSPYESLVTATRAPHEFLANHVKGASPGGMVAPGRRANLVLVAGNPLEDLTALENVVVVVRGAELVIDRRTSYGRN